MKHKEWESLSAFLDGELATDERAEVEGHLAGCSECSEALRGLSLMKKTTAAAPRRSLPPALLARMETQLAKPASTERLLRLLRAPWVAVPIGATAALAVGLFLWTARPGSDEIAFEPLIAAHLRYSAEGLVPQQNFSHPEFISHLVAYNHDAK